MKTRFVVAALMACSCLVEQGPPTTCKEIEGTVTGQLSQDLIGTWEDEVAPADHLQISAPDAVSSTTQGQTLTGKWSLSGSQLTIAWDNGVTSRPEPVFATADKLGIAHVAVQCLTQPPPPFCTAYRRVDCSDSVSK
jgi:hypothetical protein